MVTGQDFINFILNCVQIFMVTDHNFIMNGPGSHDDRSNFCNGRSRFHNDRWRFLE